MPRYYFHVRKDGVLEKDLEGAEFASADEAYYEAVIAARQIIAEKVAIGEIVNGQTFEITTEGGEVVGIVPYRSVVRFE